MPRMTRSGGDRDGVRGKRRKRSATLTRSACALSLLLVGFGAGVVVNSTHWDGDDANAASSFTDSPEYQILQDTWDLAHDEYVEGSSVDDADLIYGAAAGMIGALGDENHSRFLPPEEVEPYNRSLRGELIGIGVFLDYRGLEPLITRPIEGSPAARAGVQGEDVIVEVDGVPTTGMDSTQVSGALRGEIGTEVMISVRRPGEADLLLITLTRAEITIEPVSWGMLPDRVMHVRLSQFSGGATDGMKQAIEEGIAAGATAIILDVRDNPGGLVNEVIGVASEFLPLNDVIFKERNRDGVVTIKRTLAGQSAAELPLVLLMNANSASAAEILAGAIQDNERGLLIGETTLGTGTVLTAFPISNGASVLLGTELWLTADGEQIWKVGVEPDETVALPVGVNPTLPELDSELTSAELGASEDSQLQAAFAELTGSDATPVAP